MTTRRGFLGSILAACAAPAIVRADSLMRILPAETLVLSGDALIPASDALWVGAIREWSAWDIRTDLKLTRFDVMVRDRDGQRQQHGVDIQERPDGTMPDREAAISLLKQVVRREGCVPVKGFLQLPKGAEVARFI